MLVIFESKYPLLAISEAYAYLHHCHKNYRQIKYLPKLTYREMKDVSESIIFIDDISFSFGKLKKRRFQELLLNRDELGLTFIIITSRIDAIDKRIRANCDIRAIVMGNQTRYFNYNSKMHGKRNTEFKLILLGKQQ